MSIAFMCTGSNRLCSDGQIGVRSDVAWSRKWS